MPWLDSGWHRFTVSGSPLGSIANPLSRTLASMGPTYFNAYIDHNKETNMYVKAEKVDIMGHRSTGANEV